MNAAWTQHLTEEELVFLTRFVLASGSLKALAEAYRVSYPTVRLRLDRLIARIEVYSKSGETDPFERVLQARYADGSISKDTFKELLDSYRKHKPIKSS